MINTFLLDLDGTLLSFDQNEFLRLYFKTIEEKFIPHGYQKDVVLNALNEGINAMLKNDGSKTNEQAFWDKFNYYLSDRMYFFEKSFEDYYNNEYNTIRYIVNENKIAHKVIDVLRKKNYEIIIATNPLFPQIGTRNRMAWGGYNFDDFKLVTTYENSSYAKPNPKYFEEILKNIGKRPEECMMIGNDVGDDMVAETIGIKTYIITDNLINEHNVDMSNVNKGSFEDFYNYVLKLPKLDK